MSLTFNFSGKVVLITGSSAGIGAATAVQFSRAGANVVVTGRRADKVSEVAKECLKVSPKQSKALEVVADVTKPEDLRRLVDTTVKHFGKLDVLVNNAGAGITAKIDDKDFYDKFEKANANKSQFCGLFNAYMCRAFGENKGKYNQHLECRRYESCKQIITC